MGTDTTTADTTMRHESLLSLLRSLLTSPYVVGLALMRTWTFIVFFSSIPLSLSVPLQLIPTQQTVSNVYIISFALFTATCILCGALPQRAEAFLSHPIGSTMGPLLACLGTLLYLLPGLVGTRSLAFMLFCAAATGIGSSLTLLQLSRHCRTTRYRMVARETSAAFSLGALLSVFAFLLPPAVALALCAVLPLPCAFLALRQPLRPPDQPPHLAKDSTERHPLQHDRRVLIKFAISAGAFGIAVGLSRDLYTFSESFEFTSQQSLLHAGFMAGIMLVVLAVIVRKTRFGPLVLYRTVLILICIGLLALLFFGMDTFLPGILVSVGYMFFELLIWITFAHLSQRLNLSPLKLFGLWRGVLLACGPFLGGLIVSLCGNYAPQVFENTGVFLFAALGFLIVAYSLIFNEHDLTLLYPHSVGAAYTAIGNAAGSGVGSDEMGGTAGGGADGRASGTAGESAGGTALGGTAGGAAANSRPGDDAGLITMQAHCEQIGAHYDLSARETEVMTLMALGRSSTRIQKELFISAGTVNSHRLHIYQKLNIHSLQELLDILAEPF